MTNPISVLLIIGAAVGGPIEAQPIVAPDECKIERSQDPRWVAKCAPFVGAIATPAIPYCTEQQLKDFYTLDAKGKRLYGGPCAPKPTAHDGACVNIGFALACNPTDPRPLESLPQLCERAMREIGAEGIGDRYVLQLGVLPPAGPYPALRDLAPVRCIPTPAGYRK